VPVYGGMAGYLEISRDLKMCEGNETERGKTDDARGGQVKTSKEEDAQRGLIPAKSATKEKNQRLLTQKHSKGSGYCRVVET
jgi:hypothetical protein